MIIHKPTLDKVREWAKQTHGFQRTVSGIADAPSSIEKLELTLAFRYFRISEGQLFMSDADIDLINAEIRALTEIERIVEFIRCSKTPVSIDIIKRFKADFALSSIKYSGAIELFKNEHSFVFFGTFPGYDNCAEKHEIKVAERKAKVGRAGETPVPKKKKAASLRDTLSRRILKYLEEREGEYILKNVVDAETGGKPGTFNRACNKLIEDNKVCQLYKIGTRERYLTLVNDLDIANGFSIKHVKARRKTHSGALVRHHLEGESVVFKTQVATLYNTGVVFLHHRRYSILELKQLIMDSKRAGVLSVELQSIVGR